MFNEDRSGWPTYTAHWRRCRTALQRLLAGALAGAGLMMAPVDADAQTIDPLEFSSQIPVFEGFILYYHYGWRANWSAPQGQYIFSVDASWPRPPIELTEEQRCNHTGFSSGGQLSIALPRPVAAGSYSVTITMKRCQSNGAAGYSVVPVTSASGWGVIEEDGSGSGGSGQAPPRLTILPQTTRWRPRRDPATPIVVRFSAPGALDPTSVQLEIQPPAGFAGYVPTFDAAQPAPDATDEYTVSWTGPWQVDDGTGVMRPLPAGNYRVIVKGRAPGSSTDIASGPYSKVSLVEVGSVAVYQCNALPAAACGGPAARVDQNVTFNGNPMPGDGLAIFPDAASPGGTLQPNVLVHAAMTPDLGADASQVTVHFKLIDVDDPSAHAQGDPIDDDSAVTSATDNRNDNATIDATAAVDPALFGAVAKFSVSAGQGNNYRVVASTWSSWLTDIRGVPSSPTAALFDGAATPSPQAEVDSQSSQLLTVWRTLHLEVNHVATAHVGQQYFDETGVSTDIRPARLIDANATFVERRNRREPLCDHCGRDGWRGAELWPRDPHNGGIPPLGPIANAFPVLANRKTRLEVPAGSRLRTVASPGDPYRLRDDYWVDLSRALPLDLAREWLDRNYIRIEDIGSLDQRVSAPIVDDLQNLKAPTLATLGATPGPTTLRDAASSAAYWSVFGLTGYEANAQFSCDPCRPGVPQTGTAYGHTVGGTTSWPQQDMMQPAFAVYLETLRDRPAGQLTDVAACANGFEPMLDIVVAHEILAHTLDLGSTVDSVTDENNTATFACAADPRARQLFRRQELVLRTLTQPRVNPGNVRP